MFPTLFHNILILYVAGNNYGLDRLKSYYKAISQKFHLQLQTRTAFVNTCEFMYNKTWSSVSNSSLSKTFALCQFRKLKVQKLCFFPSNIVFIEVHFGSEKKESKNHLGSEKILIRKKSRFK